VEDIPPESTIYVVTFSGVTSGGIVTSGTMCWTCSRIDEIKNTACHGTDMGDIGLFYEGHNYGTFADTLWIEMIRTWEQL
jgi:hypothetical protein